MFKDIRKAIVEEYSGTRAKGYVAQIIQYHRIQASPGFRAAAEHCRKLLEGFGVSAEVLRFPANDSTSYWASPMFQEWDASEATLHLIEPADQARKLADFQEQKCSLIQRSAAVECAEAEVIVLEDGEEESEYAGLDLHGKLVLTRGDLGRVHALAVNQHGALGILYDGMPESPPAYGRLDLPDAVAYRSFWWRPGDKPCFGFVLSPRAGEELRHLVKSQQAEGKPAPKVRARVVSRLYDGEMEVLSAHIPGETDEEVVAVAHLCHPQPSANDNGSGSAALLEMARTLQHLIQSGKLAHPRRSVHMLWVPEMTGTFAYLATHEDEIPRMVAGINLDMVGQNQDLCRSVFMLERTPEAMPSFAADLLERLREEWLGGAHSLAGSFTYPLFRHTVAPFSGGSDHYILSDPTVGVPTPLLIQWPDQFWHTSEDTLDKVDPHMLGVLGGLATTYVYFVAQAGRREAAWLGGEMMARFRAQLARTVQDVLTDASATRSGDELGLAALSLQKKAHFAADRQREAIRSLARLAAQEHGLIDDLQQEVDRTLQQELERGRETLTRLAREIGVQGIPPAPSKEPDESQRQAEALVPSRLFRGPVSARAYMHRLTEAEREEARTWQKQHRRVYSGLSTVADYWVDGRRTVAEIADLVELETGQRDVPLLLRHFRLLDRLGLMALRASAEHTRAEHR